MGEIANFVPKSELARVRLIRESRAIYDSIFPSTAVEARPGVRPGNVMQPNSIEVQQIEHAEEPQEENSNSFGWR